MLLTLDELTSLLSHVHVVPASKVARSLMHAKKRSQSTYGTGGRSKRAALSCMVACIDIQEVMSAVKAMLN